MNDEVNKILVPMYLKELVPGFYKRLLESVEKMEDYALTNSFKEVYKISHTIAGNAESYGFAKCGNICANINDSIFDEDYSQIEEMVKTLKKEITNIKIVYVDDEEI